MDVEGVKKTLGEFADMLSFEDIGKYIVAKPRQFLGSENFAKIASIFRGINGEYISAGKESHFRVPVGIVEANPKLSLAGNHIQKAQQLMMQALEELKEAGY